MGRRRGLATPRESFATALFSDNGRLAVHRMRSRRLRGGNRSLPAGSSPGRPHPCRPTPTPSGLGAGRPRPSRAPPPPAPVGICRVLCFARFRHVGRWGCARGRIMESTEAAAPVRRGAGGAPRRRRLRLRSFAPGGRCRGGSGAAHRVKGGRRYGRRRADVQRRGRGPRVASPRGAGIRAAERRVRLLRPASCPGGGGRAHQAHPALEQGRLSRQVGSGRPLAAPCHCGR